MPWTHGWAALSCLLCAQTGFAQTAPFENLLNYRVGFGREATGGAGGKVLVIAPNEAELRAALENSEARWIRFSSSGTITLTSAINVQSNKTLDGRGQQVTIRSPNDYAFRIWNADNVILHNLIFQSALYDAVNINQGGNKKIWLDHLTLTGAGDELIDISTCCCGADCNNSGDQVHEVTVSWCKLHNNGYGVLIEGRRANQTQGPGHKVTFHHNYYVNVVDRAGPKNTSSFVHIFNNYSYNWTSDAARAGFGGQFQSEKNIFEAGPNGGTFALAAWTGGAVTVPGAYRSIGDQVLNGAVIVPTQNDPTSVFVPPYPYTPEVNDNLLKQTLVNTTGWQSDPYPAPADTLAPSAPTQLSVQ